MKAYSITDVGAKRSSNQDFVYASETPVGALPNLFIVADGMGGHNAGDLASRCTVETMLESINGSSRTSPVQILEEAIREANRKVLETSEKDREFSGMGTTVVAATVQDGYLYAANVGDSRLYLIDREGIDQVTVDHSLVEEMVRMGQIRREEAKNHPEKNIITRAVGVRSRVRIDFFDMKLEEGDRLLLCSDGLSNMVDDEEILNIVKRDEPLGMLASELVKCANLNGGRDNISVILVEPGKDGM